MVPIDLSGKVALVTGVGDNESFAWFIAKALQAAGARLVFAVHPRFVRIVEGFLTSDKEDDVASLANVHRLERGLRGPYETVILDKSYHMITVDQERNTVIDRTAAFFQRIADGQATG